MNHLWEIRRAAFTRSMDWEKELREETERLTQTLGICPDLDVLTRLYSPPVAHEELPKVEGEYNVFRIKIDGIVIRYVEEMRSIQVTMISSPRCPSWKMVRVKQRNSDQR